MMHQYLGRIKTWNYIVILIVVWSLLAMLVNPIGNFPLGEDWSFAKAVENLVKNGKLEFTGWTTMPLIVQVLWGSAFSFIFGFSFTVLRLSVLILGLLGTIGVFFFLKESGIRKAGAFIGALITAVNPFYFQLSYSFATEVPFFAFAIWSAYFYVKHFRSGKLPDFVVAVALTILTSLIKDLALAIPIAYALAMVFSGKINKDSIIKMAVAIFSVLAVFILYRLWLEYFHGLPDMYDEGRQRMLQIFYRDEYELYRNLMKNLFYAFFLLCFYSLPVLIMSIDANKYEKPSVAIPGAFFLMVAVLLIGQLGSMAENLGTYIMETATWTHFFNIRQEVTQSAAYNFPFALNAVIVLIAFASVFMVFIRVVELITFMDRRKSFSFSKYFSISIIFLYMLPVIFSGIMNRNLIYLLPFVFLLILNESIFEIKFNWKNSIAGAVVLFLMYFSVANTHDWLAVNKKKWIILDYMVNEADMSPSTIDGGFSFNGWYLYDENYIQDPSKNWWWVINDTYMISLYAAGKEYNILKKIPYRRWFPPYYKGYIYLMRKKGAPPGPSFDEISFHEYESVFFVEQLKLGN